MFVDIHSHIIPDIDDGADTLNTSVEMLRIAREEGIGKIVATPHFIWGDINNTALYIAESGSEVAAAALENGIELMFGSEVFICPEVPSLVEEGTVCRLNNSRYVLIELPMLSIPKYTADILFNLQLMGYTPIIAHPERNKVFQDHPDQLARLAERGILVQINAASITRLYGRRVRKLAMRFIKDGLVHFVATDSHTSGDRAPRMKKAYDIISRKFGRNIADQMFVCNGQAVIDDKELKFEEQIKKKRNLFYFS